MVPDLTRTMTVWRFVPLQGAVGRPNSGRMSELLPPAFFPVVELLPPRATPIGLAEQDRRHPDSPSIGSRDEPRTYSNRVRSTTDTGRLRKLLRRLSSTVQPHLRDTCLLFLSGWATAVRGLGGES
jgi:hypothetical protein